MLVSQLAPSMVSLFSVVNSLVRMILRSPLHSLLDGNLIGITYTGRRSGRRFSLVTQYAQFGNQLLVIVGEPERKNWWRNFQGKSAAEVLLRGQWLTCAAQIPGEDSERMAPRLEAYCSKFPGSARLYGLRQGKDGKFSSEEMAEAAKDIVMVVFGLPSETSAQG
jgi:hypothetical protein